MPGSRHATRLSWGLAASLLAHVLVFALVMQASRPAAPRKAAAPSRPAMLWLNVAAAPAPVQAVVQPKAVSKPKRTVAPAPAPINVPDPKPQAVAEAPALPASAPVQGIVFAPPRIALGGPAPKRWMQPPLPAEPAASSAVSEQQAALARAAQEAHKRQVMAALQRIADAPVP